MTDPVLIVGAGLAGLHTAEALRRNGWTGPVTVFGDEPHAPYNRPPLSKEALKTRATHDSMAFPRRAAVADVTWSLATRVTAADLHRRHVTTSGGAVHPYSALVIATGLRPRRLPTHGDELGCDVTVIGSTTRPTGRPSLAAWPA